MEWNIKKQVDYSYEQAIEKTKEALKNEGFGILTTIDVKEKFKEKLGVDFDRYIILGACNPAMAHKALQAEQNVGVFLPCNVIVYEHAGKTIVAAINPTATMAILKNEKLTCIAGEVEAKLRKVIQSL